MIDGSKHPFEENIRMTKEVVEYAHAHGVVVEAELGKLAGVEDNIKVDARSATFTDPDEAAEFVERMDGAYGAAIAQSGTNVSGGQKQRLSIARAVARNPEILIFDDSFSALDYRTDKALRQALRERTADSTKIIVAQRISTIRDADQILVLDHGKIVGKGTHEELLKNCPEYLEIAQSQLSKEEIAHG